MYCKVYLLKYTSGMIYWPTKSDPHRQFTLVIIKCSVRQAISSVFHLVLLPVYATQGNDISRVIFLSVFHYLVQGYGEYAAYSSKDKAGSHLDRAFFTGSTLKYIIIC